MDETIATKILDYVKKLKEPVSIKELAQEAKINYNTALKYCEILESQGKLIIKEMGNVRAVLPK
mgnify:CR=1 FL=1